MANLENIMKLRSLALFLLIIFQANSMQTMLRFGQSLSCAVKTFHFRSNNTPALGTHSEKLADLKQSSVDHNILNINKLIMSKIYTAAKAIISNDKNEFLILKQKIGEHEIWDLPGGRIEFGETPQETLMREVKEEVGLDVTIQDLKGVWWFYRTKSDNAQVICITWACSPKKFEVDIHNNPAIENITEYKWVSKEEFMKDAYIVSNESLKKCLMQADI